MNMDELILRVEHPPHNLAEKRKGSFFPRSLCRAVFPILLIFSLSHFSPLSSEIRQIEDALQEGSFLAEVFRFFNPEKQKVIQDILVVLEKYETGLAHVTKLELAEAIYEEALRYHHDPKFIVALIAIESSFRNWSVSERGAKGLMQIMPYVAQSLAEELGIEWGGDRTLFNPFLNIKMGIYYFSRLLSDFNDPGLALTAYNYGPTYVRSLIERKKQVPSNYYNKVLTVYRTL